MPRIVLVLCAFLLLTLTPSVKADPLVVTSGSFSSTGIINSGQQFTIFGENFSASGSGQLGSTQAQQCFPCVSGNVISVNGFFAGSIVSNLGSGNFIVDGMTFINVIFGGTFEFTGSAVIPAATTNVSITAPFTFVGDIRGCLQGGPPVCSPANSVFTTQLVGQGIVTVHLDFIGLNPTGNSLYQFNSLTYNFQSAEVPEPMTITLLAAGLMGFGAKWKFAKKRRL